MVVVGEDVEEEGECRLVGLIVTNEGELGGWGKRGEGEGGGVLRRDVGGEAKGGEEVGLEEGGALPRLYEEVSSSSSSSKKSRMANISDPIPTMLLATPAMFFKQATTMVGDLADV